MPLKTHQDDPPTMNLTSMTDIVFLLLVFFLVGTRFTEPERQLGLKVPEVRAQAGLPVAPEKRVVNVLRDGSITLDQTPVSLAELTERLTAARGQHPELSVLVRGDAQGEFQRVAETLTACKQAGVERLAISVRTVRK